MSHPALIQRSQTEWTFKGPHSRGHIVYQRMGLVLRYIATSTTQTQSRHFHSIEQASNWLAKQERIIQGSNNNARRNV